MDLSIIIVNYKNQNLIVQCVKSIIESEQILNYEIIVVDNYSQDSSKEVLKSIFPEIIWIQMEYNSGFARANNAALKIAKGEHILFSNPDILIKTPNLLSKCIAKQKQLPPSVLGINLTNIDGSYQETIRLKFPSLKDKIRENPIYIFIFNRLLKVNSKSVEKNKQYARHRESGYVEWINAAFLFVKKHHIDKYNLTFDEDFFLYGEDVEWSWRVKKHIPFYHFSDFTAIHIGSATMPSALKKRAQITVSDWLTIKKTRGKNYLIIQLWVEKINLKIDNILYFLAKKRGKKMKKSEKNEKKFRDIKKYLIAEYGNQIVKKTMLSFNHNFITNCYEDSFIQKQ